MSKIHITEESPTLSIKFEDTGNEVEGTVPKRELGRIGHPVEGKIDWRKTADSVKATARGDGLEIELIPR